MNEIKVYCPRCGEVTIEKEMNPSGCGDPECCGINWKEMWCVSCEDTITLCKDEMPKYNIVTGNKLKVAK
ncbi:hypothetical protein LCGC14_1190980 [marine sediment metagenome]|uniref:Uncharacterized protein n=1 Tax=marine sediment metagenome TaxID=412755 RepID=A0A0F9PPP1_9ZZZZ